MADIQFDEEQEFSRPTDTPQPSLLVRLVYKTGLATTERGAEYVLLGVALIAFLATLFIDFRHSSAPQQQNSATEPPALQAEREGTSYNK